jgi:hypothetical protein
MYIADADDGIIGGAHSFGLFTFEKIVNLPAYLALTEQIVPAYLPLTKRGPL